MEIFWGENRKTAGFTRYKRLFCDIYNLVIYFNISF